MDEENTILLAIAKSVTQNPDWKGYAEYCVHRAGGV